MRLTLFVWLVASCAAFASTEEQINKTLKVAPEGTLVVEVDSGSLDISTNGPDQVVVDVWRKITRKTKADEESFLRQNPVQILQEGTTVTIRCRHKEKIGWKGLFSNNNEAKYTVRVPARFTAQLTTAGGSIAVSDLNGEAKAQTSGGGLRFARLQGPLHGDTSGGGIRVNDCTGTINIHTSGGGIDVAGGGGSLDGSTSGGGVAVKNFNGPARVGTSGGGVTIENVTGQIKGTSSGGSVSASIAGPVKESITLTTSGGGVNLRVPADAAFNLDAECSGGGVHCELPITTEGKHESHRLKGPVNGGGPVVYLRTSGGGIRVKKP